MIKQDNVVSFENMARERATSLSHKLVKEMRAVVMDTMPKLIQSLYDKLDDGLFEQALFEKSGKSDSLDNLFFETMRQLRKRREGFIQSYIRALSKNYDDFWASNRREDDASSLLLDLDEEDLTLIDEGDLEEDLALEGIISKGMRLFSKEVYALNQRFAAMKSVENITDEMNPVAPAMISRIFPVSIKELDVDLRIKLVIYKLFEKEVVQYLGAMYDELNDLLKNAGVLPKLPSRVKKNPVSPAVKRFQEMDVSQSDGQEQQVVADLDDHAEMFNTLRGLIQRHRSPAPVEYAHLPKIEMGDLVSALSGLQQHCETEELSLDQAAASIEDLRNNLQQTLGMGVGANSVKAFGGMDEDTIDVISMLFEFILDDTNLPDAMKALLSRLQIPMLKVAILDRQFFSDKQHTARKLLNILAKSAIGWVDDGDRSENSLYGKIASIVTRILEDFHEDIALFDALYDEFYAFINKEEQGAVVIEERITEVTKGKEKMKLAQMRIAEVINTRVKGVSDLPEVVKELLKDGWKDVLTLAFLRQGEDSEKWLHVVGLVDKLLWSVQPKTEVSERQKLLKSIPELLKSLRAELVEISFDQHKLGKMFKALQACHIQALKGGDKSRVAPVAAANNPSKESKKIMEPEASQVSTLPPATVAIIKEDIIPSPLVLTKNHTKAETVRDEFDELAINLAVGSWVEWTDDDDKHLRGKLSWKSAVTGTYIFVGRKGTKLAEIMQDELAVLLRMGKAHLLEGADQPLLERAMNAMVDTLKKTGTHQT